jgi:hypothetical protein
LSKESDITKKVTNLLKAGDKLVQDVQRDIGKLAAAANSMKKTMDDIKERYKPKEGD